MHRARSLYNDVMMKIRVQSTAREHGGCQFGGSRNFTLNGLDRFRANRKECARPNTVCHHLHTDAIGNDKLVRISLNGGSLYTLAQFRRLFSSMLIPGVTKIDVPFALELLSSINQFPNLSFTSSRLCHFGRNQLNNLNRQLVAWTYALSRSRTKLV